MYNEFIEYIMPTLGTLLAGVISALGGFLIVYINKKKKALQESIDNDKAKKYIEMINTTIEDCVRATTQTYVDALKKQNAFTAEAQKEAFNMTVDNIVQILNDDCLNYLSTITQDVTDYIKNRVEAEVNIQKKY